MSSKVYEESLYQNEQIRYRTDNNYSQKNRIFDDTKYLSPLARNGMNSLAPPQKRFQDFLAQNIEKQTESLERVVNKLSVFLYTPRNPSRAQTQISSTFDSDPVHLPPILNTISVNSSMNRSALSTDNATQFIQIMNKSSESNRKIMEMMSEIQKENRFLRNAFLDKLSSAQNSNMSNVLFTPRERNTNPAVLKNAFQDKWEPLHSDQKPKQEAVTPKNMYENKSFSTRDESQNMINSSAQPYNSYGNQSDVMASRSPLLNSVKNSKFINSPTM